MAKHPSLIQLDGTSRQNCVQRPCPFRSISGLRRGQGLCPYHWAVGVWGKAWADQCFPNYARERQERIVAIGSN